MFRAIVILFVILATTGCGTTKWSDTARTGTEQLLISYAIDRAVEQIDFSVLSGKNVYVKTDAIDQATDHKYLSTAIRQQVAICGGLVRDSITDSEYVIELRTGAVGTDRNDLLFGVPAFTLPEISISGNTTGGLTTIPEIPFVKKTDQRAVCKIAVFAYHRETGRPLWCSGNRQSEGRAKAWWVFGAGPINRGNIYEGTEFAGDRMPLFFDSGGVVPNGEGYMQPLTPERYFLRSESAESDSAIAKDDDKKDDPKEGEKPAEEKNSTETKETSIAKTDDAVKEPPPAPKPGKDAPMPPTPGENTERISNSSRYGNFH